ncbi:hypothetical protein GCM10020370_36240 [Paenibacillus hodogayensis]
MVLVTEPSVPDLREALVKPMLLTGKGCYYRDRLDQWLHQENLGPLNIMEFGTVEAILRGDAGGLGVSLITRSADKEWEASGKITCHRIPEPFRDSAVSFVFRRDLFRTDAFASFTTLIGQSLAEPDLCETVDGRARKDCSSPGAGL